MTHDTSNEIWQRCEDDCQLCDQVATLEAYYEDIAVDASRGIDS